MKTGQALRIISLLRLLINTRQLIRIEKNGVSCVVQSTAPAQHGLSQCSLASDPTRWLRNGYRGTAQPGALLQESCHRKGKKRNKVIKLHHRQPEDTQSRTDNYGQRDKVAADRLQADLCFKRRFQSPVFQMPSFRQRSAPCMKHSIIGSV